MRRLLRWVLMSLIFICGGIGVLAVIMLLTTTPEERASYSITRTANAVADHATGTAGAPTAMDTATVTDTPTITLTPSIIPGSDLANIRTAQARTLGMFDDVPGVIGSVDEGSPGTASQHDDGKWYVYVELIVDEGANTTETADAVLQAAVLGLMSASIDIDMILDDGSQAISYSRNTRTDEWQITPLTMTAEPIATESVMIVATAPPAETRIPRPRNCKTAVAMGLDAQTAAQFGLDRDNDGVACYGD